MHTYIISPIERERERDTVTGVHIAHIHHLTYRERERERHSYRRPHCTHTSSHL